MKDLKIYISEKKENEVAESVPYEYRRRGFIFLFLLCLPFIILFIVTLIVILLFSSLPTLFLLIYWTGLPLCLYFLLREVIIDNIDGFLRRCENGKEKDC